jgi:uncharacterized protein DUF4838
VTTGPATVRITTLSRAAPVDLAAAELASYLPRLSAAPLAIAPESADPPPADDRALRLGTFADFGDAARDWPAVEQPEFDDAIYVEVAGLRGIIAGSNPRSVLLAAYRYLTELGCRWVRPGPDGEYLPRADLAARAVRVAEAAAYRHRGICIEGAVSYEHVRDILDWMPRVGLTAYFIQFREGYTFFDRWYRHLGNPLLQPEPFAVERARELKARLAGEMERRGIVFHDVGHGWTCECLGIPGLGWEYEPPPVPPGAERLMAEVDGRRGIWGGVALNTNLCYSNPEARDLIVGDVVQYARAHPEVDVIHFWLDDGKNNHCECAGCRQATPSDWYVRLLNELDERLTAQGLPTRIVFLIYYDLLWPPQTERIRNPDRFILMFAPITRTYTTAFTAAAPDEAPALPPFELNRLAFPTTVAGNVAFLRAWQRVFRGDSFDYDYHYMWDHYWDPGYVAIAEVFHQDVRALADLGLDGLISCQEQRAFFPTGLGMAVLGRTLWDREADFRAIAEDYYRAAFGADWEACLAYCEELSRAFDPPIQHGGQGRRDRAVAGSYARLPQVIEAFRPVIRRNLGAPDPCHARSWHYLDQHAEVWLLLAEALRHYAAGDDEAARAAWEATLRFVQERERDLHPVFDLFEFDRVVGGLFRSRADVPSPS